MRGRICHFLFLIKLTSFTTSGHEEAALEQPKMNLRRVFQHPFHHSTNAKPCCNVLLVIPHWTTHVNMQPFHFLINKLFHEKRCSDCITIKRTCIYHISNTGFHGLPITLLQGHPPKLFTTNICCFKHLLRQIFARRRHTSNRLPKSSNTGTSECSQIKYLFYSQFAGIY
nr:hypothetical protein Iba_chr08cCG14720 [Ipomoea batatas]